MKIISFILSLYILALNVMPCDHSKEADKEASILISQQDNHHKQHKESELCSPFCLDENCHIIIVYQVVEDFNFQLKTDYFNLFTYAEDKGYEILYSIFQPPRI